MQALVVLLWAGATVACLVEQARTGFVADDTAGPVQTLISGLGAAAAARASRLRRLPVRTRRAWRLLAAGYGLLLVSGGAFAAFPSFPGPGDVVRLAAVPVLLVGLLSLTDSPRSAAERGRLALDVGVVAAGGFMALWYFSLGPLTLVHDVPTVVVLTAVAYPVLDFVLLFGASAALLRGAAGVPRRVLAVLVAGLVSLVVADLGYAGAALTGTDGQDSAAEWVLLLTAFALLACAALEAGVPRDPSPVVVAARRTGAPALPLVAIAGGYALLLVVAGRSGLYPWGGLVAGAVVMTGLVVARQVLSLRENRALLMTDHLTGLATRPAFAAALDQALTRAGRERRLVGVLLIDMDGFKAVNDALGHAAGDELLVGFARLLRGAVARTDTVGRLGGDEFVAVLRDLREADDAVRVAVRLLDAMRVPLPVADGEVAARASIGVAVARAGEGERELLRRADQAMYRAKRQATGWAVADDVPPTDDVPGGVGAQAVLPGPVPGAAAG
nr:GGDEF domain-containing protein [Kineococcus siccus]